MPAMLPLLTPRQRSVYLRLSYLRRLGFELYALGIPSTLGMFCINLTYHRSVTYGSIMPKFRKKVTMSSQQGDEGSLIQSEQRSQSLATNCLYRCQTKESIMD